MASAFNVVAQFIAPVAGAGPNLPDDRAGKISFPSVGQIRQDRNSLTPAGDRRN